MVLINAYGKYKYDNKIDHQPAGLFTWQIEGLHDCTYLVYGRADPSHLTKLSN